MEFIADKLFISSFLLNKLRDFPIGMAINICGIISLFCLACAYSIQIFTSQYYHCQNQEKYHYRQICEIIASIGSCNAWLCIIFPQLWFMAMWLFSINNLLWIYNELSRLQLPSDYPYMPQNQQKYCNYVIFISSSCFISAMTTTICLLCPVNLASIHLIGTTCNWLCTMIALYSLWSSSQKPQEHHDSKLVAC